MAPQIEEAQTKEWREFVITNITELKKGHAEIKEELKKNNEMTAVILSIIEATKTFWNFCTKAARILTWVTKKGTIFAVFIVALSQAIEVILTHNIPELIRAIFRR